MVRALALAVLALVTEDRLLCGQAQGSITGPRLVLDQ
jgi:hypothetical protein